MKVALVVSRVTADRQENMSGILAAIDSVGNRGAHLAVLPEAAVTGLINNDDPVHDLPLGEEIPGRVTERLAQQARRHRLHLAVGLLEREGAALYDSAVLFGPDGTIALRYRRIQPQWHGSKADPEVYKQGRSALATDTSIGRVAVILCGDLFDDSVLEQVHALAPDWLLVPFARCFDDGAYDQARWDQEELPEYTARVCGAGCTTLMVNYVSGPGLGGYFGGAFVVSPQGEIVQRSPLGTEGILLTDLSHPCR